ncbi:hypothetical protein [Nonomuraea sp. NPDC002799]
MRSPALDEDGGRGLWLVDTLADAWGIQHGDEPGRSVWFRLSGHD